MWHEYYSHLVKATNNLWHRGKATRIRIALKPATPEPLDAQLLISKQCQNHSREVHQDAAAAPSSDGACICGVADGSYQAHLEACMLGSASRVPLSLELIDIGQSICAALCPDHEVELHPGATSGLKAE